MKKINVVTDLDKQSIVLQVFDRYYAYRQSINRKNNYQSDVEIIFSTEPIDNAVNIRIVYMPTDNNEYRDYDFLFLDNAGEPLETSNIFIKNLLDKDESNRIYFVCGAFVPESHQYYNKIVSYNHNMQLFVKLSQDGFYPQYYDRVLTQNINKSGICFINGANRSWRNYIMNLIKEKIPSIDIRSNLSDHPVETIECEFSSTDDEYFRIMVKHPGEKLHEDRYYNNTISVGVDKKFGDIVPGMFVMDEYYNYDCVAFPETSWINDEHFMTEKIFKCFVAESIPFPIGGATINKLYNQMGFMTAWNLLPENLKQYDSEYNHRKRYNMLVLALQWLSNNPEIFSSELAQEIKKNNKLCLSNPKLDLILVQKLDKILGLDA